MWAGARTASAAEPGARTEATLLRTDTLNAVPPDVRPRAAYGSFASACDSLEMLLRRTLGAYADSAVFRRDSVAFVYPDQVKLFHSNTGQPIWEMVPRDTAVSAPSLRMALTTRTDQAPGHTRIEEALDRAGWMPDLISADGPNGTVVGMVCQEALCVIDVFWDAVADDEDSTAVPTPGERIDITCVPRPPSHPYRALTRGRD